MTFGKTEEHIFLGREIAQHPDYSEATAVVIDEEIKGFIERAEATARRLLHANLDKLHVLAKALLEREIIDGRQVDEIIGRTPGSAEPIGQTAPAV